MELSVSSSEERLQRFMQLVSERLNEDREARETKKNKDFSQVYGKGFERITSLISKNPSAARLYVFLAEHIEPGTGAVVASQELLAEELGVTDRTIRRLSKVLEEEGAIIRIRLGAGSIYAYCLDPDEVWKSWNTTKKYAAFNTKTLARQKDNGDIKRRLMVMLKGNDSSDGFRDGTAEPDTQLTEENPTHQL
jgi:DNA-binding transcriptional ArsR family regulator